MASSAQSCYEHIRRWPISTRTYATQDAMLVIQTGAHTGRQHLLPQGASALTIGRDLTCDIAFDPNQERVVGRLHARIEVRPDGGVYLVDLKARNGTFLNRAPVTTEARLCFDDRILLGDGGPEILVQVGPVPVRIENAALRTLDSQVALAQRTLVLNDSPLPASATQVLAAPPGPPPSVSAWSPPGLPTPTPPPAAVNTVVLSPRSPTTGRHSAASPASHAHPTGDGYSATDTLITGAADAPTLVVQKLQTAPARPIQPDAPGPGPWNAITDAALQGDGRDAPAPSRRRDPDRRARAQIYLQMAATTVGLIVLCALGLGWALLVNQP